MSPSAPTCPAASASPALEALADAALLAVDTLLLTGAALRVTRFATTDVLGGAAFPAVGPDGRLTLTLGARGYYWLTVDPETQGGDG